MIGDAKGPAETSRRAFLGLGAFGALAAAASCSASGSSSAPAARATSSVPHRRAVAENSLPGDPRWEIRHLGPADAIIGYTGAASVLTGQSFPLFVSTTSSGFRVTAFRLGWYQGTGARQVWSSGPVHGARQKSAAVVQPTNTVVTDWDPVVHVPTDD